VKTYVGLAGRTLIPRISVAARPGKLLIFTFPGTYRKPTPWLGEKRRFCYFHLLKGIKIGEKRGKSYVGLFRGFLIKPVIGEILFLGFISSNKLALKIWTSWIDKYKIRTYSIKIIRSQKIWMFEKIWRSKKDSDVKKNPEVQKNQELQPKRSGGSQKIRML